MFRCILSIEMRIQCCNFENWLKLDVHCGQTRIIDNENRLSMIFIIDNNRLVCHSPNPIRKRADKDGGITNRLYPKSPPIPQIVQDNPLILLLELPISNDY